MAGLLDFWGFSFHLKKNFSFSDDRISCYVQWFSDAAYPIDVRIEYNEKGQPSGDALVTFATAQEATRAASKNKQHMGPR